MLWGFWPLHLWKWEDKKIGYKLISHFYLALLFASDRPILCLKLLRKTTRFQAQSKTEVRKLDWGQQVWPKVRGLRNSAEHSGGVCLLLLVLPEGHQLYTNSKIIFFSFNLESCIWETSYPVGFSPSSFHSILSIFWKQLFLIWQRCVQLQLKSVQFVFLRCSGFGKCSFNVLQFRSCREVSWWIANLYYAVFCSFFSFIIRSF